MPSTCDMTKTLVHFKLRIVLTHAAGQIFDINTAVVFMTLAWYSASSTKTTCMVVVRMVMHMSTWMPHYRYRCAPALASRAVVPVLFLQAIEHRYQRQTPFPRLSTDSADRRYEALHTSHELDIGMGEVRNTSEGHTNLVSSVAVIAPSTQAARGKYLLQKCRRLANELRAVLITEDDMRECMDKNEGVRFTMQYDEKERLGLGQPGSGFTPLVVDFSSGKAKYRSMKQQGTEQIVKAAALAKTRRPRSTPSMEMEGNVRDFPQSNEDPKDNDLPVLWDMTAGLGTDAFVLACAGWRVRMFERSPIVAKLLEDALDRARAGADETARSAASRMSLVLADSRSVVTETLSTSLQANGPRPAVVYLDPMFPHRKKSALVKKGMQMLQNLLEDNQDGNESDELARMEEECALFDAAMRLATRKVVVKRPVNGASIVKHVASTHAVVSKNGRFDVYSAVL